MELLWEIAGWTGAATILGAFMAVSLNWIQAGRGYQVANLLGACALIVNGVFHHAWPSVVLNIAWALISAYVLLRLHTSKKPLPPTADDVFSVHFPGVPDTGQFSAVDCQSSPKGGEPLPPSAQTGQAADKGHTPGLH